MAVELEQAPVCCKQSMDNIQNILDSGACLKELLAVAPTLVTPRPTISPVGVIWALGKGLWSWKQNRKLTGKMVEPIVLNRVTTVIDLEIVRHSSRKENELERQWRKMRDEFQPVA